MNATPKKICIFGTGGFGIEILCCLIDQYAALDKTVHDAEVFMVGDAYCKETSKMNIPVIPISKFEIYKK